MNSLNFILDSTEIIPHTGGIYQCRDEWSIPERTIPDFDFWYVANGRGTVTVENTEYPAGPGDLFLFRPGIKHRALHHPPRNLNVYALHFNARIRDTMELFDLYPLPPHIPLPVHAAWLSHLQQAAEEINAGTPGATRAAAYHAALFTISFIRWLHSGNSLPEPAGPFAMDSRILRIIEYITANLQKRISVADMAAVLNISESLLFKSVRAATGSSPNALANRIRVNTACRLLKDRRTTVAEAARAAGIEDEAYFSRLFKKQTGLPPKQYQLQINEEKI